MIVQPFGLLDPIKYAIKTTFKQGHWLLLAIVLFLGPFSLVSSAMRYGEFAIKKLIIGIPLLGAVFAILSIAVMFLFFASIAWFPAACAHISLTIYDGKQVGLKSLMLARQSIFSVFKIYSTMFLFFLLILGVGASLFFVHPVLSGLYVLIGMPALLWLIVRMSFSTFAIVDKKCGAMEALAFSYQLTQGWFWRLFFAQELVSYFILPFLLLLPLATCQMVIGQNNLFYSISAVGGFFYAFILYTTPWLENAYMFRKLGEFQALYKNKQEDLLAVYMSQQSKSKYGLSE